MRGCCAASTACSPSRTSGSTNGIYVNGERKQQAKLQPGDQVQVGPNVTLRFSMIDVAEEALARQLFDSSTRDALTHAFNRKYLMGRLVSEVAYAERHKSRLGLLLFDLDHFKQVNDEHGHIAGDAVLQGVAGFVTRLIRTEDVFARYGGEEFVVLVRGIPHDEASSASPRGSGGGSSRSRFPWEKGVLPGQGQHRRRLAPRAGASRRGRGGLRRRGAPRSGRRPALQSQGCRPQLRRLFVAP